MNIISNYKPTLRNLIRKLILLTALALGSCIQGPWDYTPKNPPVYQGIWVTGSIIAKLPVQSICFEKFVPLNQESTPAFGFYDSAAINVTGNFNGSVTTVNLSPNSNVPNCFSGDTSQKAMNGESYTLNARIVWDSAGESKVTRISATANIPHLFSINDSATTPALAFTGQVPENIFSVEGFNSLPKNTKAIISKEYDSLQIYFLDTTGQGNYLAKNGRAIQARVFKLVQQETKNYTEKDTLFYLNGAFNTLSHYYLSTRSDDVEDVLITQFFDSTGYRPETAFDSPVGIKPKPEEYYFPGHIRRLLDYPSFPKKNGGNVLDSLGVVNTWFQTKLNRLYFYGYEKAYSDYTQTAIQQADDPRVKPKYNIIGAAGIFAGAIKDSFDVLIKTDNLTKSYSVQAVRANYCHSKGWFDNADCRGYYRSYCAENKWKDPDCREDAIYTCMERKDSVNSPCDSAMVWQKISGLKEKTDLKYCTEKNFLVSASNTTCLPAKKSCFEQKESNACKRELWEYCLVENWKPEQCQLGLVSYCLDKPGRSDVLCKHAQAYCESHKSEKLCQ